VSAIVPNYNHARFLKQRFTSILAQRPNVWEIIVLDDASTDDSRELIQSITKDLPIPVRAVLNDANSGSVFAQWAKGISLAEGDLVWVCESDDSCDSRFLETLVPYFEDRSVMLAFGWTDLMDENGAPYAGMERYMGGAAPMAYWKTPRTASAFTWFHGPFGARNIIPNVGGCIFRRQQISSDFLAALVAYKVCGDWYLYSRVAHGGRIVYDPSARAYFRQHRANTSTLGFRTESFHEEHISIALALRRHYGIGQETVRRLLALAYRHHRSIFGRAAGRNFAKRHSLEKVLAQGRTVAHVLIAVQVPQSDAAMFPIELANALSRRGYDVSLLLPGSEAMQEVISGMLAPQIPVFSTATVARRGVQQFLADFGVSLLHTHDVSIDKWFYETCEEVRVPYVVTHHGSYDRKPVSKEFTAWLRANVDHWVYGSEKGLVLAKQVARDDCALTKLPHPGEAVDVYSAIYGQLLPRPHTVEVVPANPTGG
jgi:glycosyltransferase involved in cell wall biosynthesis